MLLHFHLTNDWTLVNGIAMLEDIFHNIKSRGLQIPTITVTTKDGDELCRFTMSDVNEYRVDLDNTKDEQKESVLEALRVSGLLDQMFTYTDSNVPFSSDPQRKRSLSKEFGKWMQKITKDRVLVPDTNALLHHVFSSLSVAIGEDFIKNTPMMIPRLVILEMESKANNKKTDKKTKRKLFLGFSELMFLKSHNSQLFPDLGDELLTNFTKISGELTGDSWIRREIKRYPQNYLKQKVERGGAKTMGDIPKFLFVTADFVNSLSAMAEEIDTVYVSAMDNNATHTANLEQIAKFLINISVLEERTNFSVGGTDYALLGFWSGKTTYQLLNNVVKIKSPPDTTTDST